MNYIIASTGRARSSILARYLKQVNAGYADVWLNSWFNALRDYYDLDALCRFIRNKSHDGRCALRLTWDMLRNVCHTHNISAKTFFEKSVPDAQFIYFTRNNLSQTTETLYYKHTQMFDDPPDFIPFKDIEKSIISYAKDESSWESLFDTYSITPYRITYEELLADTPLVLKNILNFLDTPYPDDIELVDLSKDALVGSSEVKNWYDRKIRRFIDRMEEENRL